MRSELISILFENTIRCRRSSGYKPTYSLKDLCIKCIRRHDMQMNMMENMKIWDENFSLGRDKCID